MDHSLLSSGFHDEVAVRHGAFEQLQQLQLQLTQEQRSSSSKLCSSRQLKYRAVCAFQRGQLSQACGINELLPKSKVDQTNLKNVNTTVCLYIGQLRLSLLVSMIFATNILVIFLLATEFLSESSAFFFNWRGSNSKNSSVGRKEYGVDYQGRVIERNPKLNMFSAKKKGEFPIQCGEEVMNQKAHGTCEKPVMKNLRWKCDWNTADRICCFNRHYAEHAGYWETTSFLNEVSMMMLLINTISD